MTIARKNGKSRLAGEWMEQIADAMPIEKDTVGLVLTLKKPLPYQAVNNIRSAMDAFNDALIAAGSNKLAVLIVDDSMIDVKVVQK